MPPIRADPRRRVFHGPRWSDPHQRRSL